MSKQCDCIPWPVHAALLAFIAFVGFACGGGCGMRLARNEAIEAGVGQWVIDAKTGERSFVYGVSEENE